MNLFPKLDFASPVGVSAVQPHVFTCNSLQSIIIQMFVVSPPINLKNRKQFDLSKQVL